MTQTKHTPAPWEVSGNGIWGVSPWNARFRLATVTTPSPMNGIDWQANARLIAAAPKLLSKLRAVAELRRKWRSLDEAETIDSIEYMDGLDALDLDAVIAEAEGRGA